MSRAATCIARVAGLLDGVRESSPGATSAAELMWQITELADAVTRTTGRH